MIRPMSLVLRLMKASNETSDESGSSSISPTISSTAWIMCGGLRLHAHACKTKRYGHIDISLHAWHDIMRKGEWMLIDNEQKKYESTWHTRALALSKQFDGKCRLHSLHWGMSTQRRQRPPFDNGIPQLRQRPIGHSAAAAIIIYTVINVILFHWNKTTMKLYIYYDNCTYIYWLSISV